MKKLNLIVLSIAAISIICVSCGKSQIGEATKTTISEENKEVSEVVIYTIPLDLLEKELQALMDGNEKENFDYNRATVKLLADQNVYEITIEDLDIDVFPFELVCSGNGYSFASCVGDWFETNPDKCLLITYNSHSDTYYADDNC